MSFMAYWLGAKTAAIMGYGNHASIFWLGYAWLFLVELATVLTNDYFDYHSDEKNKYFSPFTGGSRTLVDKQLSFKEVKAGIAASMILSIIALLSLLYSNHNSFAVLLITL